MPLAENPPNSCQTTTNAAATRRRNAIKPSQLLTGISADSFEKEFESVQDVFELQVRLCLSPIGARRLAGPLSVA